MLILKLVIVAKLLILEIIKQWNIYMGSGLYVYTWYMNKQLQISSLSLLPWLNWALGIMCEMHMTCTSK